MSKPTVLFLCQHNAGRSQLGAALLEILAGDRYTATSARHFARGHRKPGDRVDRRGARPRHHKPHSPRYHCRRPRECGHCGRDEARTSPPREAVRTVPRVGVSRPGRLDCGECPPASRRLSVSGSGLNCSSNPLRTTSGSWRSRPPHKSVRLLLAQIRASPPGEVAVERPRKMHSVVQCSSLSGHPARSCSARSRRARRRSRRARFSSI